MDWYTTSVIPYIVIFLLIIILYFFCQKKKKYLYTKEYRADIYNNTPAQYKESIRYLYDKLEQLDEIIVSNSDKLNLQSTQVASDVLEKASDAERKIKEYWESSKKKADFYYFIGLHYTSFTLADKLTRELETLRKTKKILSDSINSTQSQIDLLKREIEKSNFTQNIRILKRDHQELCRKCDALRKTRKICVQQISVYKKRRDMQNEITKQRREYIGNNFGKKGKQWRNRIRAKHTM